jgi:5-methylphenazine-1-carboxylate 1-monooxygenase
VDDILIAGGGIGGFAAALSLHQAGFPVRVFETVEQVQALGVGINLLPHAVRELDELGLLEKLLQVGHAPDHLSYYTKRGELIWSETRGLLAGYKWPQISVHRGHLQRFLYDAAVERIGADRVHTGHHLDSFEQDSHGVAAHFIDRRTGASIGTHAGSLLIAADGIHSVIRKHFYPDEGMPKWNGAILWRGMAEGPPVFDGKTLVWAGHARQKFVFYPISPVVNGRQQLNFIAELVFDETELAEREDWNKQGNLQDFLPQFESWNFDWLNVPELIRSAPATYQFPMVDRDPLERWTHGRVTLLGDAAHPMYPVGSNGGSQAILDARALAGCLLSYPSDPLLALEKYDEARRPPTSGIVLANRGHGPERPMTLVEERAPDGFADINDVITPEEVLQCTEGYRRAAGFAMADLNDRPTLAAAQY